METDDRWMKFLTTGIKLYLEKTDLNGFPKTGSSQWLNIWQVQFLFEHRTLAKNVTLSNTTHKHLPSNAQYRARKR